MYSHNLFYSKLDFDSFVRENGVKKESIIDNLLLTHIFYMSYPSENVFNINFTEMDKILKNSLTYLLRYNYNTKILEKKVLQKEVVQKDFKGGFLNKIKLYDNHSELSANRWPDMSINEITLCFILNYICTSPPVILTRKKVY